MKRWIWRGRNVHFDGIVSVRAALEALDLGRHLSVGDDCSRTRSRNDLTHGGVQRIDVFSVRFGDVQAMSSEGLGNAIALEVFGGVTTAL